MSDEEEDAQEKQQMMLIANGPNMPWSGHTYGELLLRKSALRKQNKATVRALDEARARVAELEKRADATKAEVEREVFPVMRQQLQSAQFGFIEATDRAVKSEARVRELEAAIGELDPYLDEAEVLFQAAERCGAIEKGRTQEFYAARAALSQPHPGAPLLADLRERLEKAERELAAEREDHEATKRQILERP